MDIYRQATIAEKNRNNDEKMDGSSIKGNIVNKELDTIIIQYSDGSFSEGYTDDFSPVIPFFHLFQIHEKSRDEGIKIYFDDIKLILFVQSAEDNSLNNTDTCIPPSNNHIEV